MSVYITNVVRSPAVKYALRKCLPAGVSETVHGVEMRQCMTDFVDRAKRFVFLLVFAIGVLATTIVDVMFIVVDLLVPSRHREDPKSVTVGPVVSGKNTVVFDDPATFDEM